MRKNLGPFIGVNNKRRPTDLTVNIDRSKLDLMAAATNVDVVDGGKVRRRDGFTLRHEGGYHSLWGDGHAMGYVVRGAELLAVNADCALRTVQSNMLQGVPVSFTRHADVVFWTDCMRLGAVRGEQPVKPTPTLPLEPDVRAADDGALEAGQYQVVFALTGPLGEGPATQPFVVHLQKNQAIHISGLIEPEGFAINCYMTGPNGTVFHKAELLRFEQQGRIPLQADAGAPAQTIGLVGMPAGRLVRSYDARLLVARDNVLFYSQPFAPLLMNPISNHISFEQPIVLVRPCGAGVFVATTSATYWLAGDLPAANLTQVLPYGAAVDSDCMDPAHPDTALWMSARGVVRGRPDGSVANLQEKNVAVGAGVQASTYVRERNGQSHVIAAVQPPNQTRGAMAVSMTAEIINRSV